MDRLFSYLFCVSYRSILPVACISIFLFGSQVRINNIFIQDTQLLTQSMGLKTVRIQLGDRDFRNQSTHRWVQWARQSRPFFFLLVLYIQYLAHLQACLPTHINLSAQAKLALIQFILIALFIVTETVLRNHRSVAFVYDSKKTI